MSESRPRILAIDDTPANLLTLGAALSEHYDLQTAISGEMGIALAILPVVTGILCAWIACARWPKVAPSI